MENQNYLNQAKKYFYSLYFQIEVCYEIILKNLLLLNNDNIIDLNKSNLI